MIRTYRELIRLPTHRERYDYLKVAGVVGQETFGFERWMNQQFYRSTEWRHIRQHVIARDLGCDLGVEGYEIYDRVYVHHMNPLTQRDIASGDSAMVDPDFLICVTLRTHNAIHYGTEELLPKPMVERRPGDTKIW